MCAAFAVVSWDQSARRATGRETNVHEGPCGAVGAGATFQCRVAGGRLRRSQPSFASIRDLRLTPDEVAHVTDVPQVGMDAGREALRRFLVGGDDLATMQTRIAQIATETIPACDLASISLVQPDGTPATPAFTAKTALFLDDTQYALGDGPCLAAIRHRGVEHLTTASDARWPSFSSAAHGRGVLAVLSVPLGNEEAVLGSLNLYSETTARYGDEAHRVASAFADQLGVAAATVTRYARGYELSLQLQEAMASRAVIEQAKGILMASERCSPDDAFDVLVRASQNQNRKLRDVASDVVRRYANTDDPAAAG
ncbi:MAG: GAF and ANTAR domain-containing protein [Acidimicrobiia bacterium]|nr:GAF and ANTAR domain-containing protein [Acidimicrobiia bacterium]